MLRHASYYFLAFNLSPITFFPFLYFASKHRANTERRPREECINSLLQKALFLIPPPKKVDSVSEKVDPIPKKVAGIDCTLRTYSQVYRSFILIENNHAKFKNLPKCRNTTKNTKNICIYQKNRVIL